MRPDVRPPLLLLLVGRVASQLAPLPNCGSLTCQLGTCPGGSEFNFVSENCTACPAGKQTTGGSEPCGYCPQSMVPNDARNGCECQVFHVNTWDANGTADSCVPCAEVANCDPCRSTKLGPDLTMTSVIDGHPNCLAGGSSSRQSCECGGGVPGGSANLCPSEGFYLQFNSSANDSYHLEAGDPLAPSFGVLASQQVNAVHKLLPCSKHGTFAAARSRCRHWSDCAEREGRTDLTTCTPGENCCAPGYGGPMCEFCEAPRIRIAGACMICSGYDWDRIVLAAVCALAFVLYIIYSSTKNFRMAKGTFTIMIFYFQTSALLLQDKKLVAIEWLIGLFDLDFMKQTSFSRETYESGTTTCVTPFDFYGQFYWSLSANVVCFVCFYITAIILSTLTSERKHLISKVRLDCLPAYLLLYLF